MALSVVDLYSKEYIDKMGSEYICTGFMFDVKETKKDLPEQLASYDIVGVIASDDDQYSMSPSDQGAAAPGGSQAGGMGGGSY